MKGLVLYIKEENLKSVTKILTESGVEGITYFDIQGRGKLDREKKEERTVEGYRTGKKHTPDFATRLRVESIVTDSTYADIMTRIKQDKSIKGKVIVYNVEESLDL